MSILKLYDPYNLRARISAGFVYLAPILFPLYLLVPEIRELSTTIVTIIVGFGISNLIISCSGMFGKKAKKACFPEIYPAQKMLLSCDNTLDGKTKTRYQQFFIERLSGLTFNGTTEENTASANTAIKWIIARTRDSEKFPLIFEENSNFGFVCNLYGLKPSGIIVCVLILLLEVVLLLLTLKGTISFSSIQSLCISIFMSMLFFMMWIFLITKDLVREAGYKYARALLSACDSDFFTAK